ncbi:AaceriAAL039Cp [[Ashbya] aceris (nom. inval.)]|nr:AaceriAAL039Cp [[Ashbya] aceris (nom. inval.)]
MQQEHNIEAINNFAIWQNDDLVSNCLHCHLKFTFLLRKHHCRCCGGIFCASCTQHFEHYDLSKVKVLQRCEGVVEAAPYRTCDSCYENLLHRGLLAGAQDGPAGQVAGSSLREGVGDVEEPARKLVKDDTVRETVAEHGSEHSSTVVSVRARPEEYDHCPLCNADLSGDPEDTAAEHVQNCIARATSVQQHLVCESPGPMSYQNRILVSIVPDYTEGGGRLPECPICFEDMEPGQKVGRLECLCVFHNECIQMWLERKSRKTRSGGWPARSPKNFCPLHDAIV